MRRRLCDLAAATKCGENRGVAREASQIYADLHKITQLPHVGGLMIVATYPVLPPLYLRGTLSENNAEERQASHPFMLSNNDGDRGYLDKG